MKNKIYITIPAGVVAGGVEALYQLADVIRQSGGESYVVYNKNHHNPFPEKYRHYDIHISNKVEDDKNNWIIYPEIWTKRVNEFRNIKKVIWWLSVDNNYNQFNDWGNENITHLYQSYYAFTHILNNGGSYYLPLFEYINNNYLCKSSPIEHKQNIICYNPAKGQEITNEIIRLNPDLTFVPLTGMSQNQIIDTLSISKIYIDFGHHPGRDRIPREAAILNNCIITNLKGSARFYNDVPIKNKYKTDSHESVGDLLRDCFVNFETNLKDFELYRNSIKQQKQEMINQTLQIFGI